jgi:hypothetical protein
MSVREAGGLEEPINLVESDDGRLECFGLPLLGLGLKLAGKPRLPGTEQGGQRGLSTRAKYRKTEQMRAEPAGEPDPDSP